MVSDPRPLVSRRKFAAALLLLASALSGASAEAPRTSLDPLWLGELGFKVVSRQGERLETVSGFDAAGLPARVNVAPTRPAVVYFFPARLASSRAALAALEDLRASYAGKLGFVAVSEDLRGEVRACVNGLALSLPVLSECGLGSGVGVTRAPAYLVVAPGGWILARRDGAFDWSSLSGRALLEEILSLFAEAPPEIYGMPPTAPVAPAASASSSPKQPGPNPAATSVSDLAASDPARDLRAPAWLSPLEAAVVEELNLARTKPALYADYLRDYRSHIQGRLLLRDGRMAVRLIEGGGAVDEAIAFLVAQEALPAFAVSKGLSLAARRHAEDQGRSGATGHSGSDGSSPFERMERFGEWRGSAGENCSYGPDTAREIVISLIVDDGVPSRGHRANIFSPDFLAVGVAVSPHAVYGTVCVQDFAWDFREK